MALVTLPGVFAPISDSWMLAEAIAAEPIGPGSQVLDLCTGSGVLALAAAATGADVTAVDVSRRALLTVRLNARREGVRVEARRGRGFDAIGDRRFDLITSNPPYVPSASDELPTRGPARAWAAGPDGRAVLDSLCDRAPEHLTPGGAILVVHSSLIGEDRTLQRLQLAGLEDVRVIRRQRGPLGPLMRQQQRAGRIPPVQEEDVIVVRAAMPGAGVSREGRAGSRPGRR